MAYEIVIADDDETIREVVEYNLTDEGWDAIVFEDGDECWEYLESQAGDPPDLAVLDVMMPELDGVSVLERIRHHDALVDLPVVMLTSRNREEDIGIPDRHEGLLGAETAHAIDAVLAFLDEPPLPEGELEAFLDAIQPEWTQLPNGRVSTPQK